MPRKNVEAIQLHVPIGAKDKIKSHVEKRKIAGVSEYLRRLVEADMELHGEPIDLTVDRGGDRRKPSGTPDEQEEA